MLICIPLKTYILKYYNKPKVKLKSFKDFYKKVLLYFSFTYFIVFLIYHILNKLFNDKD